jgi:hypothetical protein
MSFKFSASRLCKKCGQRKPIKSGKMSASGKDFVCGECKPKVKR